ncbi:MAG: hypothetical protein ACREJM_15220 [Candidatus Saccharimonadales bacterium]
MDRLSCPQPDELTAFSVGRLDDADLDRVAAHLERCEQCLETIAALDDSTDALLGDLRRTRPHVSPETSDACRRAVARAAAMVVSRSGVLGD